jgi:hypothetical protein
MAGDAPDPLGKRALFWMPGTEGTARPLGRRAFYSDAVDDVQPGAGQGPITVTCSGCGAVSRIGWLDFLIFQLPVGVWLPRGRFDRLMTCPACRRRRWVGVTLRRR